MINIIDFDDPSAFKTKFIVFGFRHSVRDNRFGIGFHEHKFGRIVLGIAFLF
jgi:hypothetical protein